MGSANFLRNLGLTNHDAGSLGDYAGVIVPHDALSTCDCGFFQIGGENRKGCPNCNRALFWENLPKSRVKVKITHFAKRQAKKCSQDILSNQACRAIPRHEISLSSRNMEPVSVKSLKIPKSMGTISSAHFCFTNKCLILNYKEEGEKILISPLRVGFTSKPRVYEPTEEIIFDEED